MNQTEMLLDRLYAEIDRLRAERDALRTSGARLANFVSHYAKQTGYTLKDGDCQMLLGAIDQWDAAVRATWGAKE